MRIGIDIGGSHIAVGLIQEYKIIDFVDRDFLLEDKKNIEDAIINYSTQFINLLLERNKKTLEDLELIGISAPGTAINGVMISSGNIGIKNYPIIERLQEKIKLPMKIGNDAKCAAIAEKEYGCLKSYDRSIFLTLGTGIGGAAFLDNKLLKAGQRPGYEFGHMVIEKNGMPCNCGRKGCFEVYASMKVFKRNLRKALNVDEKVRGKELLEILKKNNPENDNYEIIESVVEEYIENLSIGILNLISIFEPEVVGIGGSFVHFKEILLPRLREKIQKVNEEKRNIIIETAILENNAGIIGATL